MVLITLTKRKKGQKSIGVEDNLNCRGRRLCDFAPLSIFEFNALEDVVQLY